MSAPIPLRRDFGASHLRGLAKKTKDGPQTRRLLALAASPTPPHRRLSTRRATIPATSQLDRLISMTAISVPLARSGNARVRRGMI